MVLHRDFLMRSIEQLVQTFLKVSSREGSSKPEEMQRDLEDALGDVLGVEGAFALAQGPGAIELLDSAVAAEAARLLLLHAALSEETGRDVQQAAALAMSALQRGFEPPFGKRTELAEDLVRDHAAGLETLFGPERVAELFMSAFRWRAEWGDYAEAEDWLFDAVERDARHATEGIAFYEGLAALTGDELERGGLPRGEVAESLEELRGLAAAQK